MRKGILLSVLFMSVFGMAVAQAAEEKAPVAPLQEESKLGVSLDLTYVSKWLSKGIEGYGSQGGLFATLDLDFYGTGFGVKVTHRNATGSGYVDKQRFDYRPYYKGTLFEGEYFETDFNFSVGYESYYGLTRNKANTTYEYILSTAWPQLLGHNLVPRYIAHYESAASSNIISPYNHIAGWVHRFILDYNIEIAELPKPLKFSSEIAYYDGLAGQDKDSDWMYTTFGLSTSFKINDNLTCAPGVYHQITMDDSLMASHNKKDITYGMISVKYTF